MATDINMMQKKLDELLQPSTFKSLVDMSRSDVENRQKIENFVINLKQKLVLELWPNDGVVTCACGQHMDMDAWGDRAFCGTVVTKTTMSNDNPI